MLGFWSSCGSMGNVIGAFLTSSILVNNSWQSTYAIVASFNLVQIGVNMLFMHEPVSAVVLGGIEEDFEEQTPIGFMEAFRLPDVLLSSFEYFALKFIYYSLMMWLPLCLK